MPVKGWMNVRSLPDTKNKTVKEVIEKFFKKHILCKDCNGRGFNVDDEKIDLLPGTTTVKFSGHGSLEKMDEANNLTSDTVKKIVETVVYNRNQCDKCKGFGFVKQSRKKHEGHN